jgi:hypothetical protein
MVARVLSCNVETPISAVSVLVIFGWVALVSPMRQRTGTFRRVTRFGQVLGQAVLAGLPGGLSVHIS